MLQTHFPYLNFYAWVSEISQEWSSHHPFILFLLPLFLYLIKTIFCMKAQASFFEVGGVALPYHYFSTWRIETPSKI